MRTFVLSSAVVLPLVSLVVVVAVVLEITAADCRRP